MILYKLPEHMAKLLLKNHFLSSPMSFLIFLSMLSAALLCGAPGRGAQAARQPSRERFNF
jgi:hypothetical protein